MPIHRNDRPDIGMTVAAGLKHFGIIHKGLPKTRSENGKTKAGNDLAYFRVELFERFQYLRPTLEHFYGDKPTAFDPVMLMGSSVDAAFPCWRIQRDSQRITRRCDGLHQVFWVDKTGSHGVGFGDEVRDCTGDNPRGGCKACGYSGWLSVVLVDFCRQANAYGFFSLHTSSQQDVDHIHDALANLESLSDALRLDRLMFRLGRDTEGELRRVGWRWATSRDTNEPMQVEVRKSLLQLELSEVSERQVVALLTAQAEKLVASGLPALPALPPPVVPGAVVRPLVGGVDSLTGDDDVDVDGDYEELDGDEDEDEAADKGVAPYYLAHSVYVQYTKQQNHFTYVLRVDADHNFSLYNGNLFRDIGYDPAGWKTNGYVEKFDPPLRVYVDAAGVVTKLEKGIVQESLL